MRLTVVFTFPFALLLIALLVVIGMLAEQNRQHYMQLQLYESARAYFEQVINTRLWNARHGGVYVEI
ncbi:MAG: hypothetical protein GWN14_22755, partial [candidate division Zixibacteria bacterium]|nr:hypothetical protein [candidate division Zixibacteria bacterium]